MRTTRAHSVQSARPSEATTISPSHSLTPKPAKAKAKASAIKRKAPEPEEDAADDDDQETSNRANEPTGKKRQSQAPATPASEPKMEESADDSDDAPEEIGGSEVRAAQNRARLVAPNRAGRRRNEEQMLNELLRQLLAKGTTPRTFPLLGLTSRELPPLVEQRRRPSEGIETRAHGSL